MIIKIKNKLYQKNIFIDDKSSSFIFFSKLNPIYETDGLWIVIRNYEELVQYVTKNGLNGVDIISFYDDITWEMFREGNIDYNKTKDEAYLCLEWVIRYCVRSWGKEILPKCLFNSKSVQGTKNMVRLYEAWKDDI